ncbi:hypothetical protein ACI3K4_22935 [Streptomyces sp. CSMPJR101]|uniref:hypothetical protein n=1 Tax=Streptomyces sp. CSMPJR101 TaxID=1279378 RepID=UPI0038522179
MSEVATFVHVRLRQRGGLPELTTVLGRFTPIVQALPPGAAVAQLGGSPRLFAAGPVELAQRIRLQALAWFGLETLLGIGQCWFVAAAPTGP